MFLQKSAIQTLKTQNDATSIETRLFDLQQTRNDKEQQLQALNHEFSNAHKFSQEKTKLSLMEKELLKKQKALDAM